MRAHTVGDGFDQVGPLPLTRTRGGRADGGVDAQDIITVDPDPGKAVALGAVDDGAGGLLRQRDRNRPVVVLTEEDHGGLEDAGKIHGFVPVAL